MPYEYLDHQADIGVRGIGSTPKEALAEGARAMLHIMVNPKTVMSTVNIPLRCEADDLESLFVAMLNELLYLREVKDTTLIDFRITRMQERQDGWVLEGIATGEPLNPARHEFLTEVKAATYFGLVYYVENGRHIIECVVDV